MSRKNLLEETSQKDRRLTRVIPASDIYVEDEHFFEHDTILNQGVPDNCSMNSDYDVIEKMKGMTPKQVEELLHKLNLSESSLDADCDTTMTADEIEQGTLVEKEIEANMQGNKTKSAHNKKGTKANAKNVKTTPLEPKSTDIENLPKPECTIEQETKTKRVRQLKTNNSNDIAFKEVPKSKVIEPTVNSIELLSQGAESNKEIEKEIKSKRIKKGKKEETDNTITYDNTKKEDNENASMETLTNNVQPSNASGLNSEEETKTIRSRKVKKDVEYNLDSKLIAHSGMKEKVKDVPNKINSDETKTNKSEKAKGKQNTNKNSTMVQLEPKVSKNDNSIENIENLAENTSKVKKDTVQKILTDSDNTENKMQDKTNKSKESAKEKKDKKLQSDKLKKTSATSKKQADDDNTTNEESTTIKNKKNQKTETRNTEKGTEKSNVESGAPLKTKKDSKNDVQKVEAHKSKPTSKVDPPKGKKKGNNKENKMDKEEETIPKRVTRKKQI